MAMTHARTRCLIHEDCLVDLELSIACGPNQIDMQALQGEWDWLFGRNGWGDGYSGGNGDGCSGGEGDGGASGLSYGYGGGGCDFGDGVGGGSVVPGHRP